MSSLWKIEGVDARLTKLWTEDGLSTSKIAADLAIFTGVPLTRNAVIGRIHRLGLVKAEPVEAEGAPTKAPVSQKAAEALAADPAPVAPAPPAPPAGPAPAARPRPSDVHVTMLRTGQCRFPITPHHAEIHYFCADPVEAPGASYCSVHAPLCYDRRTPQEKRADQERTAKMRATRAAA